MKCYQWFLCLGLIVVTAGPALAEPPQVIKLKFLDFATKSKLSQVVVPGPRRTSQPQRTGVAKAVGRKALAQASVPLMWTPGSNGLITSQSGPFPSVSPTFQPSPKAGVQYGVGKANLPSQKPPKNTVLGGLDKIPHHLRMKQVWEKGHSAYAEYKHEQGKMTDWVPLSRKDRFGRVVPRDASHILVEFEDDDSWPCDAFVTSVEVFHHPNDIHPTKYKVDLDDYENNPLPRLAWKLTIPSIYKFRIKYQMIYKWSHCKFRMLLPEASQFLKTSHQFDLIGGVEYGGGSVEIDVPGNSNPANAKAGQGKNTSVVQANIPDISRFKTTHIRAVVPKNCTGVKITQRWIKVSGRYVKVDNLEDQKFEIYKVFGSTGIHIEAVRLRIEGGAVPPPPPPGSGTATAAAPTTVCTIPVYIRQIP